MIYTKGTYEISQENLLNNSRKPMKYLKETYDISQGNLSNTLITHYIWQGNPSYMSRKLII